MLWLTNQVISKCVSRLIQRGASMQAGRYIDQRICRQTGMQVGIKASWNTVRRYTRGLGVKSALYSPASVGEGRYAGKRADSQVNKQICRYASLWGDKCIYSPEYSPSNIQTGQYVNEQLCRPTDG